MAIIAGARPESNCETFALLLAALMALYVLYVAIVRPYALRLETGFALLLGLLQLALGIACVLSLRGAVDFGTVGGISLTLYAASLIQTAVLAIYHFVELERRRQSDSDDASLLVPMNAEEHMTTTESGSSPVSSDISQPQPPQQQNPLIA